MIQNSIVLASHENSISWKSISLLISRKWQSIAYGNGRFVALPIGDLSYETDEANAEAELSLLIDIVPPVPPDEKQYVSIVYSDDGIIWEKSKTIECWPWKSIVYGDGKFVIISRYPDSSQNNPSNIAVYIQNSYETWR